MMREIEIKLVGTAPFIMRRWTEEERYMMTHLTTWKAPLQGPRLSGTQVALQHLYALDADGNLDEGWWKRASGLVIPHRRNDTIDAWRQRREQATI